MNAPRSCHGLPNPIAPRCNMDCSQCYSLDKKKLYPEEKKVRMRYAVPETHVRGVVEAAVAAGQTYFFESCTMFFRHAGDRLKTLAAGAA